MAMTWRPPEDLAEKLRVVAFVSRRSANDIVNEAVRNWLATEGQEAVSSADDSVFNRLCKR
jgi:predicted transcriptional regulator